MQPGRNLWGSPVVLIGGGFLALCVLAIAFVGLASAGQRLKLRAEVGRFVETQATVIGGKVERRHKSYEPVVRFSYRAAGQELTGTNGLTVTPVTEKEAKAVISAHPLKHQFPVYYDPEHPKRVVVTREVSVATSAFLASIGMVLVALVIAIRVGFAYARHRRTQREASSAVAPGA